MQPAQPSKAMQEVIGIIACEHCDALHARAPLASGEIARCSRCHAELERNLGRRWQYLLPLTLSALILFIIANAFPIVALDIQGQVNQTTLMGAVLALSEEGTSLIALLVLITIILLPLLQLLLLIYILLGHQKKQHPPGFQLMVRTLQLIQPWGMVEVFMLGVLVALIKLMNMADIIPGIALWAFSGLTILLTVIISFDPRNFWQSEFPRSAKTTPTVVMNHEP